MTTLTKKKVLTAADVMAKSKSTAPSTSTEDSQAPPQLFAEAIYDDFQSSLLLLEKRIKSGRSSLSVHEVQQFEEQTARIVREMNEYMNDPVGMSERIQRGYDNIQVGVAAPAADEESTDATFISTLPVAAVSSAAVLSSSSFPAPPPPSIANINPPALESESTSIINNNSNNNNSDETTKADGDNNNRKEKGEEEIDGDEEYAGFGLARGTTNTYAIPGMDEMSPEEYREKLQETISARQASTRYYHLVCCRIPIPWHPFDAQT